jgi:uncharacterized protein YaiL (DUF2058 family)
MGNSLQEQLIQAGLAESDQVRDQRKKKAPKKKKGKPKGGGRAASPQKGQHKPTQGDGDSAEAAPPKNERERIARLRRVVAKHRLPRSNADTPYRFTLGQRIKEIAVTAEQQRQLARGEAGIVNVQGRFDVLPAEAVGQVRNLDPAVVVVLNNPGAPAATANIDA